MKNPAARVGLWAALAETSCTIVYIIGLFALVGLSLARSTPAELATQGWPGIQAYAQHYADDPTALTVGLVVQVSAFASGLLILVVFLALHELAEPAKKFFTRLASAFALLLALTSSWAYYIQWGSVHQAILRGGDLEGLAQFVESYIASPAMATLQLGWAFFYGLACLAMLPALGPTRLERWVKLAFGVNGVIGVLIGLAYALGLTGLLPFAVLGLAATSFAYPLLAIHFHRKQKR
jgi:hypothetical protein